MLGAKSEADQPGRQPLQQRPPREEPQRQRRRQFPGALENTADDPVLHEDLYRLHRPGREFPPALNGAEIVIGDLAAQKTRRQDVGRGDSVLDCRSTATVSSLTSGQSPSSLTRSRR